MPNAIENKNSMFSYDKLQRLEVPKTLYIASADKKIRGAVRLTACKTDFYFNNCSQLTFTTWKKYSGELEKYYDEIQVSRYVLFHVGDYEHWFRICNVKKINSGNNEGAEVTASSIECELGQTYVTALGSLGTDEDEQGGLDMYCLYNPDDQSHSIMHRVIQKNPSWSIGYIDPDITTEYRIINEDRISSYDLLRSKCSELFECIFTFDTCNKTISAYKLENIGKCTRVYLSHRNVLKTTEIDYDTDDIKTVFYVSGGTDATNTALGISDVNPSGNNYISNYGYFLNEMSEELRSKYQEYLKKMEENAPLYQAALSEQQKLYEDLGKLQTAHPEDKESTDWGKYGSVELASKVETYHKIMSIYNDESEGENYQIAYKNYNAASQELGKRKQQIAECEKAIQTAAEKSQSYVVNIADFLGEKLYKELSVYNYEDTFVDDSFIATDVMSESEIFEMKKALYEHAKKELNKVCYPQFTLTLTPINFIGAEKYQRYAEQIEVGNIITIQLDEHTMKCLEARLLKLSYNWYNPSDFEMVFSSKTSLEDGVFEFQDIQNTVDKISNSLNISTSAWNNASKSSATASADMKTFLDASLREVRNSTDNEVNIDGTGITIRKNNGDSTYDPNQLWMTRGNIVMTDDSFKSIKIAIGGVTVKNRRVYGIAAPLLCGTQIISENMQITNKNNTLTMGEDGFVAESTNGYRLQINPDQPNQIFTIQKSGEAILGVDAATNKFVFKGTLESKDGHIGGWTINADSLYAANVGLASSGDVRIWAGGANGDNAAFKVKADGSLSIGSKLSAGIDGKLTCSDADISGKVTATSGKIGGWLIDGNSLVGSSGSSYIRGGSIDIGNSLFSADDDAVYMGNFYVQSGHRGIFSSENQEVGMMSSASGKNQLYLWAGASNDPYPFAVNGAGETHATTLYASELNATTINGSAKLTGSNWWSGYTLFEALDWLYDHLGSDSSDE